MKLESIWLQMVLALHINEKVHICVQDERRKDHISEQFPDRDVVGINVLSLAENGGEIHCVTQQQPDAGEF